MNNQTKIKATVVDGGKMAKPLNPFTMSNVTPMVGLNNFESYHEFDKANPALPLIPPRPDLEGQTVSTKEIWQFRIKNETGNHWNKENETVYSKYNSFEDYCKFLADGNIELRKIYQLVEAEKEKPKNWKANINDFTPSQITYFEERDRLNSLATLKGSEESVEEAANRWIVANVDKAYNREAIFIAGANWQKQQSKDEVVAIIKRKLDTAQFSTDTRKELTDLLATINKK